MEEFDFENRIVSPTEIMGDNGDDNPLRPRKLEDYIGQDKAKQNLAVFMEAAKRRNECLDHVLLYGNIRACNRKAGRFGSNAYKSE